MEVSSKLDFHPYCVVVECIYVYSRMVTLGVKKRGYVSQNHLLDTYLIHTFVKKM